jgi:dTDP-4-dehydrorhamnose 3,5-epimerase
VIVNATELPGVAVVEMEPSRDERGSFARTFDAELFADHGLESDVVQCSTSSSPCAGTLRGLHYQLAPHQEGKLVRCIRGRVWDVVVDLRADSPTHCRWLGLELDADGVRMLFIPKGCAHGFQTLLDDSEVSYQMTVAYVPAAARGVRWDDPAFAIRWPEPPPGGRIISERDRAFPDYMAPVDRSAPSAGARPTPTLTQAREQERERAR